MRVKYKSPLLGPCDPRKQRAEVTLYDDDGIATIRFIYPERRDDPAPVMQLDAQQWDAFVQDVLAVPLEKWRRDPWPFIDREERIYVASGVHSDTALKPQEDGGALLSQKDSRKIQVVPASVWAAILNWIHGAPPSSIMFLPAEAA